MLARSFLSAEDLKISESTYETLIKVLGLLERGELVHQPVSNIDYLEDNEPVVFTGHFNMVEWSENTRCGTVCCIGGTAELLGADELYHDQVHSVELYNLFYPYEANMLWKNITVPMAARAVANFLTSGKPSWAEAVKNV